MTIQYSPDDFNEVSALLMWRGTILPAVLFKPAIWFIMLAHFTFFWLHVYHEEITMPHLPWKLVGMPTSLLTFFLVFYSGNCFSRYYTLYSKCTGMSGNVMAFTGLLRVHFPKATSEELFNLCRYAVASVYLLYFQLSGGASEGGKLVVDHEWEVLLRTNLLAREEIGRLRAYKGFNAFLLQVWALNAVKGKLDESGNGKNLKPFQEQMLQLRGNCDAIITSMAQPIPFPYYHTLTLMLSLNLLLMAYAMIEFETIMTMPCMFIICLVALGLKETAVALSDPFGGDDVDFETEQYMAQMLSSTMSLISAESDSPGIYLPLVTGSKALQAARNK